MLLLEDPSKEKIEWLINQSQQKAANWLKDLEDGHVYYWPADWTTHAQMANKLQIKEYEKGIAVKT